MDCLRADRLALSDLWQVVVNFVPLGLRGDEIMRSRRRRQRRIERPQPQAHDIGHRIAATDDRRTAVGAEDAMNAWRRIECLQRRLALDDDEVTGRDGRIGRKCGSGRLATERTVAIDRRAKLAANFVFHCATETTAFMHKALFLEFEKRQQATAVGYQAVHGSGVGAALFDLTLRPAACRSMHALEEAASGLNAGLLTTIGF